MAHRTLKSGGGTQYRLWRLSMTAGGDRWTGSWSFGAVRGSIRESDGSAVGVGATR